MPKKRKPKPPTVDVNVEAAATMDMDRILPKPIPQDTDESEPRATEGILPRPAPICWAAWDTPERIAAHPVICNKPGDASPRLMFATFDNGSLKVSATRRPAMMLTEAARIARAMHTWIDSALVSEPGVKFSQIAQILLRHLRLDGYRFIGGGVFEELSIEEALRELAQIRSIAEPPEAPRTFHHEPVVPSFLRKETLMSNEETVQAAHLPTLTVANVAIQQDTDGRYCLNDLHKASGGEKRHQPSDWLRIKQAQELIEEITAPGITGAKQNQVVRVYQGGNGPQGTYVCKELVYAYAMWISPRFSLMVIRAFDALVMGQRPGIGLGIPYVVERAVEAASLRTAMESRDRTLAVFGSLADEGDRELVWQVAVRAKERIEQHLRQLARRHLKNHNPEQVAAWIMAWTPEKATGVLH
jgi:hypothetical protein